jgi:hypothetical protein
MGSHLPSTTLTFLRAHENRRWQGSHRPAWNGKGLVQR